jgi:rSAM-associated Gly-rich repeat protein
VSASHRYRKILSVLLPAGALSMSIMLGSTGAQAALEISAGSQASLLPPAPVSERLGAIRDAVSDVVRLAGKTPIEGTERLAWGNFGFSIPLPFPFWNNGWGNGGWRNGGWHNGGWHNGGWHNGGWHNWGNGWRNY